jgi:hypothetical protein
MSFEYLASLPSLELDAVEADLVDYNREVAKAAAKGS